MTASPLCPDIYHEIDRRPRPVGPTAAKKRLDAAGSRAVYFKKYNAFEQSSDPTRAMVTLRTVDGFSVCFSIPRRQQSQLGEALVAQPMPSVTLRPH
jgi:hypothetical protein